MALLSFAGMRAVRSREPLDEMTSGERLWAGLGYYAAMAIHASAIIYACDRLFQHAAI